jgi:MerR family transcriptional regulator, light-induced transcriptional regulator
MSHDLHWVPEARQELDYERLKTFTDPRAPVVTKPTESHLQEFAAIIENVIVPRLLMTHVNGDARPAPTVIADETVADFITLTMSESPEAAVNFVRDLLDNGVPFQKILLDLMAPAARELGARWVHDSTSFVEVTLGVARMHRILRDFDGVPAHLWSHEGQGLHALLLPAPGEHHTFGLRLVQEFLLREAWTVTNHPVENLARLGTLVSEEHFDVIGLSLSGETLIDSFTSAIATIRKKSKNRHVRIIVGGHIFAERPELIRTCGADAFGADAPSSVAIVNGWARELAAVT